MTWPGFSDWMACRISGMREQRSASRQGISINSRLPAAAVEIKKSKGACARIHSRQRRFFLTRRCRMDNFGPACVLIVLGGFANGQETSAIPSCGSARLLLPINIRSFRKKTTFVTKMERKGRIMNADSQTDSKQTPEILASEENGVTSTTSTNSPGETPSGVQPTGFSQPASPDFSEAVFPEGSLIERFVEFAGKQIESAPVFILGAFLPLIARCIGRQAWFPWGSGRIYPNIYCILAGKPGDRKSSAITLAQQVVSTPSGDGDQLLGPSAFLASSLSSEALFDEYDEKTGGCPDKLLHEEEGNIFLGNIAKSQYGERVGHRLLTLYDCKALSENFKRNKREPQDQSPEGRRFIAETSTSILLGATNDVASFQGAAIRAGLQRRFLYYLAEGHGGFIPMPPDANIEELRAIAQRLHHIKTSCAGTFRFSPEALKLWTEIQTRNRVKLQTAQNEAAAGRLNGEPMHILKIAMLFAASLEHNVEQKVISPETLDCAARHVGVCNAAAAQVDHVGQREHIAQSAEILLSRICRDYHHLIDSNGWINVSRSELTAKYAAHPGRQGTMTPNQIYLRLIPIMESEGKAKLVSKTGKAEIWAFRAEGA